MSPVGYMHQQWKRNHSCGNVISFDKSLNKHLDPALFSFLFFIFSVCICERACWRQNHDGSMKQDRQKLKSMIHMGPI